MPGSCNKGLRSRPSGAAGSRRSNGLEVSSMNSRKPMLTRPMTARMRATTGSGRWLLKILGRDDRFVFGVYRRHMKAISYLGRLDRLFGVPVTTRNWNTITAIHKVLGNGRTEVVPRPARETTPKTKRPS